MGTCLGMASAVCVVCKGSVLEEAWHQGHLGTSCAGGKGAVLFLGISVQPCADQHSRAVAVPGVAFLPPPSLGNLTRGLFVPVFPQSTDRWYYPWFGQQNRKQTNVVLPQHCSCATLPYELGMSPISTGGLTHCRQIFDLFLYFFFCPCNTLIGTSARFKSVHSPTPFTLLQ